MQASVECGGMKEALFPHTHSAEEVDFMRAYSIPSWISFKKKDTLEPLQEAPLNYGLQGSDEFANEENLTWTQVRLSSYTTEGEMLN